MIHDVDESLRALVKRDALNGARVDIAFDAPTKDWAARQNAPSVSLYLYDIREDLQRREVAWEPRRAADGIVGEHRLPARRYRLSYLVTAWTQRPEDEHRLLAALLQAFLRHPVIPEELASGSLSESSLPVYMTVALPPPEDRSIADVWSALGGELKPSLDLVITAPMDVSRKIDAAPPVLEHGLHLRSADGASEFASRFGDGRGRRARRGPLLPAEEAAQEETIVAGRAADEDADKADKGKRSGRGGTGVERSVEGESAVPGRRIRIRGISRP